ncbi:MAG: hypothetical protein MI919_42665 [Holophagales bacterium]|nr:hypothetical protein [Holophagales bacterium]
MGYDQSSRPWKLRAWYRHRVAPSGWTVWARMALVLAMALLIGFVAAVAGARAQETPAEGAESSSGPETAAEDGARAYEVDREASVFAVITHKAGLAARLAHDHLVVAGDVESELRFDPSAPDRARFTLTAPSASLVVDDPAAQARWGPRIVELGILEQVFGELSEGDRRKIHESMVGKKQLRVEEYPRIRAEVLGITEGGSTPGFPYTIHLEMEVVGKSSKGFLAGRYELEGERLVVEAFGELRFTDFGIEPYSAMLGAVRNDDPFHLFLYLEAVPGG